MRKITGIPLFCVFIPGRAGFVCFLSQDKCYSDGSAGKVLSFILERETHMCKAAARPSIIVYLAFYALLSSSICAEPITVATIGDSTVCDYAPSYEYLLRGWGQMLPDLLDVDATVYNGAVSGASSKSFYEANEGAYWQSVLNQDPDYVLIQFGHNDHPGKGADRETDPDPDAPQDISYREFLRKYIDETRAIGGTPILVTPMARRYFTGDYINNSVGILDQYTAAMIDVGAEENVTVANLNASSIGLFERLGPLDHFVMSPPDKVADKTHFGPRGATAMAKLILDDLVAHSNPLASYVDWPEANCWQMDSLAGSVILDEVPTESLTTYSLPQDGRSIIDVALDFHWLDYAMPWSIDVFGLDDPEDPGQFLCTFTLSEENCAAQTSESGKQALLDFLNAEDDDVMLKLQTSGMPLSDADPPSLFLEYTFVPGDVDGDCFTGADDLVTILSYWGQTGITRRQGDLTGDGFVGADDYV